MVPSTSNIDSDYFRMCAECQKEIRSQPKFPVTGVLGEHRRSEVVNDPQIMDAKAKRLPFVEVGGGPGHDTTYKMGTPELI